MMALAMVLGLAWAEDPVVDGDFLKVMTGPIGEGPWKFGGGGAQAWDPNANVEDGWTEYYCRTTFITGTGSWDVSVDPAAGCADESKTVRIGVTPLIIGVHPVAPGGELKNAVPAKAFHEAGTYKITAKLEDGTEATAMALIADAGPNTKLELICAPTGLKAPTKKGTTWKIQRIGDGTKFGGCAKNDERWLYLLNLNPS